MTPEEFTAQFEDAKAFALTLGSRRALVADKQLLDEAQLHLDNLIAGILEHETGGLALASAPPPSPPEPAPQTQGQPG